MLCRIEGKWGCVKRVGDCAIGVVLVLSLMYRLFTQIRIIMRHEMKLAQEPFEKIRDGRKTIESRLYDEKRKAISIGDEIVFTRNDNATQEVLTTVVALHTFMDFRALMTALPAEKFGWTTAEEAINEIGQFYSNEDVAKAGVVGIELALHA